MPILTSRAQRIFVSHPPATQGHRDRVLSSTTRRRRSMQLKSPVTPDYVPIAFLRDVIRPESSELARQISRFQQANIISFVKIVSLICHSHLAMDKEGCGFAHAMCHTASHPFCMNFPSISFPQICRVQDTISCWTRLSQSLQGSRTLKYLALSCCSLWHPEPRFLLKSSGSSPYP